MRLTLPSAGVATIIRIPYVRFLSITDDFLFATTDVAIWSTVESGLGICAASAATLRPLFRTFYSSTPSGTNKTHRTPIFGNQVSTWRSSHLGYVKSVDLGKSRSDGDDSLELRDGIGRRSETRNEITAAGMELNRKESKKLQKNGEVGRNEDSMNSELFIQGIQVSKTVDIEREDLNYEPASVADSSQTPWPRSTDLEG